MKVCAVSRKPHPDDCIAPGNKLRPSPTPTLRHHLPLHPPLVAVRVCYKSVKAAEPITALFAASDAPTLDCPLPRRAPAPRLIYQGPKQRPGGPRYGESHHRNLMAASWVPPRFSVQQVHRPRRRRRHRRALIGGSCFPSVAVDMIFF